jgi:hypothetical protein
VLRFKLETALVRALIWFVAVLINATIAIGSAAFCFESEPSLPAKAVAAAVAASFLVVTAALALSRFTRPPQWAKKAVTAWCIALPFAFFLSSLDRSLISGQEALATILVGAFSWATWRSYGNPSDQIRTGRINS